MRRRPGAERPLVSGGVPHPSWNLDRPIIFASERPAEPERMIGERRTVTPEEIWALVDAAG
jgi:hypothetical protein